MLIQYLALRQLDPFQRLFFRKFPFPNSLICYRKLNFDRKILGTVIFDSLFDNEPANRFFQDHFFILLFFQDKVNLLFFFHHTLQADCPILLVLQQSLLFQLKQSQFRDRLTLILKLFILEGRLAVSDLYKAVDRTLWPKFICQFFYVVIPLKLQQILLRVKIQSVYFYCTETETPGPSERLPCILFFVEMGLDDIPKDIQAYFFCAEKHQIYLFQATSKEFIKICAQTELDNPKYICTPIYSKSVGTPIYMPPFLLLRLYSPARYSNFCLFNFPQNQQKVWTASNANWDVFGDIFWTIFRLFIILENGRDGQLGDLRAGKPKNGRKYTENIQYDIGSEESSQLFYVSAAGCVHLQEIESVVVEVVLVVHGVDGPDHFLSVFFAELLFFQVKHDGLKHFVLGDDAVVIEIEVEESSLDLEAEDLKSRGKGEEGCQECPPAHDFTVFVNCYCNAIFVLALKRGEFITACL